MSYRKADSVIQWFVRNDLGFGMSLKKMSKPEEIGKALLERYGPKGLTLEGLDPDDQEGLLERFNAMSEE